MDTIRFDPRTADELAAPPPGLTADWVWPGYLARGNLSILTGVWKEGKTTLVTGLLRRLAAGGPFLDRPCPPAAAFVVSEEDDAHWVVRERAAPIGSHVRFVCRPFAAQPTPDLWDAFVRRVEDRRRSAPLDLLVIDPLAAFLPGRSESDPATIHDLLHPLRRFAAGGSAVLLLHHPAKGATTEGSAARGSGALLAAVDVVMELYACGGLAADGCRRRLVARSRLPDTPRQIVYEMVPGTADFRLVGDPALERFRENWETVRAILAGRKTAATHKELLTDWPADRLPPSPSQLYEWLGRALGEGWVTRTGHGIRRDPFRFRLPPPPEEDPSFFQDPLPDLRPYRNGGFD